MLFKFLKTLDRPRKKLVKELLTARKLRESIDKRADTIHDEFTNGLDFISKFPRSVTFFGSARTYAGEHDYEKARRIAHRISKELKYTVVTGGGPGIMEAANRGAYEAQGDSIGLNIQIPEEQTTNPYITKTMSFRYFFSRKVCLTFSAETFLFFPGGLGTLDEFFEIYMLFQTNKIQRVPIILVGSHFWRPLEKFLRKNLLKGEKIDEEDLKIFKILDDEDKIIEIIKNAPIVRHE